MFARRDLDETKVILHKNLEDLLDRGEKLDDLVDKSEGLSSSVRRWLDSPYLRQIPTVVCNYARNQKRGSNSMVRRHNRPCASSMTNLPFFVTGKDVLPRCQENKLFVLPRNVIKCIRQPRPARPTVCTHLRAPPLAVINGYMRSITPRTSFY